MKKIQSLVSKIKTLVEFLEGEQKKFTNILYHIPKVITFNGEDTESGK